MTAERGYWSGPAAVLVVFAVFAAFVGWCVDGVRAEARDGQAATAQTPAPAGKPEAVPVLSEVDRLKVLNASMAVENWTLKVQAAVGELQKSRAEFDRIVGAVTPAGWQLNDKLEFVKVDKPKGGG